MVYNGKTKLHSMNKFFMDRESIKECMLLLKRKNSEGYDRIPQRVLVDGIEHLLDPLTHLFHLIYNQKKIPEQWLIAKTIPVFKNKGDKKSGGAADSNDGSVVNQINLSLVLLYSHLLGQS